MHKYVLTGKTNQELFKKANMDILSKLITKQMDWKYEKEWRIVIANYNRIIPQKIEYPEYKYVLDLKNNIKAFYLVISPPNLIIKAFKYWDPVKFTVTDNNISKLLFSPTA